jgi:hypothetical protein
MTVSLGLRRNRGFMEYNRTKTINRRFRDICRLARLLLQDIDRQTVEDMRNTVRIDNEDLNIRITIDWIDSDRKAQKPVVGFANKTRIFVAEDDMPDDDSSRQEVPMEEVLRNLKSRGTQHG